MSEVCPSCGAWCDRLDDVTGWCDECVALLTDSKRCTRCDAMRCLDAFRRSRDGRRSVCRICENQARRQWREAHVEVERERERLRQIRRRAAAKSPSSPRVLLET